MAAISKESVTIIQKLRVFFSEDPNVILAFIFGSVATGKAGKRSDLDIAVFFTRPLEGMDLLCYANTLSNLAGKDVDLVTLNNSSALLRHQVMKHRTDLIIKDEDILAQFREKTMLDYDEYKYVSGMNVYD